MCIVQVHVVVQARAEPAVIMELSLLLENLKKDDSIRDDSRLPRPTKGDIVKTITLLMTHAAEPMPLYSSV